MTNNIVADCYENAPNESSPSIRQNQQTDAAENMYQGNMDPEKSPYEPTTESITKKPELVMVEMPPVTETPKALSHSPPTPPLPPYDSSSSSTAPLTAPSATSGSSFDFGSFWKSLHMIIVVIASATMNGVIFGVINNFGVLYAHLIELSKTDIGLLGFQSMATGDNITAEAAGSYSAKNSSSTSAALVQPLIAGVGSLNVGLIFFCSIFASVLSDRYGIRSICLIGGILSTVGIYASSVSLNIFYLYVMYGVVFGIGGSLVYAPSLTILGHYFTKRLGLVNGLVTAGSSAFSIVMPILLRWLLDKVGIQVTFKYLSILMATLILCSLSFKEQIKRTRQNDSAKKKLTNMFFYDALWKNNLYLYWVISIPLGLFGYFVPFCHLVKHTRDINSSYPGEVLVMSIGLTSMIGRLITGQLSDLARVNRIVLQQIAFASFGLLTMALPFVRDVPLLLICCSLGLFDGTFISLIGPIAFDLVGPEYANQAIGLLLCFCSLPLTIGPPLAAYVYNIYGNYQLAFVVAGIPPVFAALLMINIVRLQKIQRRRASTVKLGIDEPRIFDDMIIQNGHQNHLPANNQKSLNLNGEKLHLLMNGGTDKQPSINGTTKLNMVNEDHDNNAGEKTGLLKLGNASTNANNGNGRCRDNEIEILPVKANHTVDDDSNVAANQLRKSSLRI